VEIKKEALIRDTQGRVNMSFEAENLGSAPNSLSKNVLLSAVTPRRDRYELSFEITDEDRSLPPYQPRNFLANATVSDDLVFLWFKRYSFKASRGGRTHVYILSAQGKVMGRIPFHLRSLIYKWFGSLPD
jgi:hypothetical protein